jgi:hypothetical protein
MPNLQRIDLQRRWLDAILAICAPPHTRLGDRDDERRDENKKRMG